MKDQKIFTPEFQQKLSEKGIPDIDTFVKEGLTYSKGSLADFIMQHDDLDELSGKEIAHLNGMKSMIRFFEEMRNGLVA